MFTCPLCAKTFSLQNILQSHIFTHTKEKPYRCLKCSATFSQLGSVKTHVKIVHDGAKFQSLECHVCGHKCTGRGNLNKHLLKHSTERPVSCTVPSCSFRTKSHNGLQNHFRRVHLRETPYECKSEGCSYKTFDAGNLTRHLKVHSNEKPFACKVPGCNYTCKTKPYLTAHTNGVHGDDKPWKCSTCDFQTKLRSTLNTHQATHRSMKRFHCQATNCRYASNSKTGIVAHFDRKHRKKEILCTEPRCSYKCGTTALLKIHLKQHNLPILKCPAASCNFSTRSKGRLLIHSSRNHGETQFVSTLESSKSNIVGVQPNSVVAGARHCPRPNCNFQTDFPHRYDRNMIAHDRQKQRKLACKFCPSRFNLSANLERHIQRHLGERPYSCSHCDYTGIDGGNVRRHAQRVHRIFVIPRWDEHQYERSCRTCNFKSSSYSEFILHSMTHLKPIVVLKRLRAHQL